MSSRELGPFLMTEAPHAPPPGIASETRGETLKIRHGSGCCSCERAGPTVARYGEQDEPDRQDEARCDRHELLLPEPRTNNSSRHFNAPQGSLCLVCFHQRRTCPLQRAAILLQLSEANMLSPSSRIAASHALTACLRDDGGAGGSKYRYEYRTPTSPRAATRTRTVRVL